MNENVFVPIADLPGRYNVSRQTLYDRIKFLKLYTPKMSGQKHISSQDIDVLDRFHAHIMSGKNKSSFTPGEADFDLVPQVVSKPVVKETSDVAKIKDIKPVEYVQGDLLALIERIVDRDKPIDYLGNYRALKEASENQWVLSTQKVYELTNVKPHGDGFTWGSFRVVRCGKLGRSSGWVVESVS
jgi:hypothetical protein